MIRTRSLIRRLATLYPQSLREPWDRGGLMCGTLPLETGKVLLLLDLDEIAWEKGKEFRPDLVITHHPFLFGPKGKVFREDPRKEALYEEISESGTAVLSYHTNFDSAPYGMNEALAERLGLLDAHPVPECPMMWGGSLPEEMETGAFARRAVALLGSGHGSLIKGRERVRTVAIIGGGGSREWRIAMEKGFDIYLSGDCPHHARRDIVRYGYSYLDLPHEIERIFMDRMREVLLGMDPTLEILALDHEEEPLLV